MSYQPPRNILAAGLRLPGVNGFIHIPQFIEDTEADQLLVHCLRHICWKQEHFCLFGKAVTAPRLTAWYGEPGVTYRYSGVSRHAKRWPSRLRCLAELIGNRLSTSFNFVLANRYRSGNDCVGWHADDEHGLAPIIASLSLGETRVFRVKPKKVGTSIGLPIKHGDLVIMWGPFQCDFKHAVPRTAKPKGERVNLTLRWLSN